MDDSFIKTPPIDFSTFRTKGAERSLEDAKPSSEKEIKEAAKDFEALLVQQMLTSWWKTVPSSGGGAYQILVRKNFLETCSIKNYLNR